MTVMHRFAAAASREKRIGQRTFIWMSPDSPFGLHMSDRWLDRTVPFDHGVPLDDVGQIAIHVFLCDHFDTRVDDPRQRNT